MNTYIYFFLLINHIETNHDEFLDQPMCPNNAESTVHKMCVTFASSSVTIFLSNSLKFFLWSACSFNRVSVLPGSTKSDFSNFCMPT